MNDRTVIYLYKSPHSNLAKSVVERAVLEYAFGASPNGNNLKKGTVSLWTTEYIWVRLEGCDRDRAERERFRAPSLRRGDLISQRRLKTSEFKNQPLKKIKQFHSTCKLPEMQRSDSP